MASDLHPAYLSTYRCLSIVTYGLRPKAMGALRPKRRVGRDVVSRDCTAALTYHIAR